MNALSCAVVPAEHLKRRGFYVAGLRGESFEAYTTRTEADYLAYWSQPQYAAAMGAEQARAEVAAYRAGLAMRAITNARPERPCEWSDYERRVEERKGGERRCLSRLSV